MLQLQNHQNVIFEITVLFAFLSKHNPFIGLAPCLVEDRHCRGTRTLHMFQKAPEMSFSFSKLPLLQVIYCLIVHKTIAELMLNSIIESKESSNKSQNSASGHQESGQQSGGASGRDGSNPSVSRESGSGNNGQSGGSSSGNSGNDSSVFGGAWSREEELMLCFLFKKYGGDWQLVTRLLHEGQQCFQARAKEDVKLHFLRLIRKTLATYQFDEKLAEERRIRHMIRVLYQEQKEEFRKTTWDIQQKLSHIISEGLVKNWHLSPEEVNIKAKQLKAVLFEFRRLHKREKNSPSTSDSNRNSIDCDIEPGYQSDFSSFFAEDEDGDSSRGIKLRNRSCYSNSSDEGYDPYYQKKRVLRKQVHLQGMKSLLAEQGVLEYDQEKRRSTEPRQDEGEGSLKPIRVERQFAQGIGCGNREQGLVKGTCKE